MENHTGKESPTLIRVADKNKMDAVCLSMCNVNELLQCVLIDCTADQVDFEATMRNNLSSFKEVLGVRDVMLKRRSIGGMPVRILCKTGSDTMNIISTMTSDIAPDLYDTIIIFKEERDPESGLCMLASLSQEEKALIRDHLVLVRVKGDSSNGAYSNVIVVDRGELE